MTNFDEIVKLSILTTLGIIVIEVMEQSLHSADNYFQWLLEIAYLMAFIIHNFTA